MIMAANVSNKPTETINSEKVNTNLFSSNNSTLRKPVVAKAAMPRSTTPASIMNPPATATSFCGLESFRELCLVNVRFSSMGKLVNGVVI